MTSEGLGEMFEGDSADTCVRKFPLMLMGGRANSPACADGLNKSNCSFLVQWDQIVYCSEQSECTAFRYCRQNLVAAVVAILVQVDYELDFLGKWKTTSFLL